MSASHQIQDPAAALAFALAGNARFTLVSKKTGARFTFRVRQPKKRGGSVPLRDGGGGTARVTMVEGGSWGTRVYGVKPAPHFVSVLTGPSNEADFKFIGTVFDKETFRHGRKSAFSWETACVGAFTWTWSMLRLGRMPDSLEFWHEGKCGRCGRTLTVPSSIEAGIGPECAKGPM